MGYQDAPRLNASNFQAWREKVKIKISAQGSDFWRMVINGYDDKTPLNQVEILDA